MTSKVTPIFLFVVCSAISESEIMTNDGRGVEMGKGSVGKMYLV
jgi:hypothetical protein